MVSDPELEELRSRADIVQVIGEKIPLKRSGHNFKGVCPFHAEKTPSFMVHPEKQIYHCFGCGVGGDVFSFLMKLEGLSFGEAIERLADRFGVILTKKGQETSEGLEGIRKARAEKEIFVKLNRLACRFFYETLLGDLGKKGRDYLEKRQIASETIQEFFLGYASAEGRLLTRYLTEKKAPLDLAVRLGLIRQGTGGDYFDFFRDRLVIAIVSVDGRILGFSGRALEDEVQPKYLNSPDSPIYHKSGSLLGIHLAKAAIRELDQVILVEGNFDLVRLHQAGFKNVAAPLGTALTEQQVTLLSRFTQNFVLLFDGDAAGLRASERALEIFLPLGISPKVVTLPQGEDPDSFVIHQGKEALQALISSAPPLLDARIELILKSEGKEPQGQAKAVKKIMDLIALLPGEIEKRLYFQRLADRFGLPESLFRREVRNSSNFSKANDDVKAVLPRVVLPPIEKTILEVLLSGSVSPGILFQEISTQDFSRPELVEIWGIMKADYGRHGGLDVARILMEMPEGGTRNLVTELCFGGGRWKDEGNKVAEDCVKQFRVTRIKGKLKELSVEIRKAETEQDALRMSELLNEKNGLIKEMNSLH